MPNNNEQIVVKPSKWKSFKDTYFLTGSIDIPFLGLTIALLTIGLIMLFSASYPYAYYYKDSSYYYFIRSSCGSLRANPFHQHHAQRVKL